MPVTRPSHIRTRVDLVPPESASSPAERAAGKKQIRRNQILDILRSNGSLSRVEIARELGFNLRTVSALIDNMVAEGLVTEEKAKKTALGRRPTPVCFNPAAACVLGIDVGKSLTTALVTNLAGTVLGRHEHPSPPTGDAAALADWLEKFSLEVLDTHSTSLPPLAGIGIGLPGLVHTPDSAGRTLKPEAAQIHKRLESLYEVPIIVDNDARMMAVGQLWFGKNSDNRAAGETFAVVNLGYGLGLGIAIEGSVYQGFHGHAGELGHVRLGDPGIPCHCGGHSCLENIASGSGIERMAVEAGLQVDKRPMSAAEVLDAARQGLPEARAIVTRFAGGLAQGLGLVVNLFNPSTIVLVGRITRSADLFLEDVIRELENQAYPAIRKETQVMVSDLRDNAGPLGTCASVLQRIFQLTHLSVKNVV